MKYNIKLLSLALILPTLVACGGGGSNSASITTPIPSADNIPPRVQFPLAEKFGEGFEGIAFSFTSTDGDRDERTHAIMGPDGDFFSLSAPRYNGTQADIDLILNQVQDFENPSDANGDGIYEVTVTVNDGQATHSIDGELELMDRSIPFGTPLTLSTDLTQPMQILGYQDRNTIIIGKSGRVVLENHDDFPNLASTTMLDLTGQISTNGERGLLGGALSPDFGNDQKIYLSLTNLDGNVEIRSYQLFANQEEAFDPATEEIIITIERPRANHNAGWIGFAPDNTLWIPTGDSGGANDPDNLAQDPFALQGKVLRIDVTADDYPNDITKNYAIPSDNPFADGVMGAPEVFALGLRNPFRAAIEPFTGDLYIGDVGQGRREEINRLSISSPGLNFGWPIVEGLLQNTGPNSSDFIPPVLEYDHTGGRGSIVVGDIGFWTTDFSSESHLIFSDFYSGEMWLLQTNLLLPGQTISASDFDGSPLISIPDDSLVSAFPEPFDGTGLTSYNFDREIFEATDISGNRIVFERPLPL